MNTCDAVDLAPDVLEQGRRVPEVPRIELEPERRLIAGVPDQLDGLGNGGRDRPLGTAVSLIRLQRDPDTGKSGLARKCAEPVDDDLMRAVDNGLRSNFITARAAGRRIW